MKKKFWNRPEVFTLAVSMTASGSPTTNFEGSRDDANGTNNPGAYRGDPLPSSS